MEAIRSSLPITVLLLAVLLLTGCAGSRNPDDPLEPLNRSIYRFNDSIDKAVIKPVAQGYKAVMPSPAKIMIDNFISNLDDILVTANDLLQFKFTQAASDGARVLFNSTFGVFGLFNVAHRLEKHHEDFGQTLGYWGVSPGPYLVLPVLGPSSVRDATGLYVDGFASVPYNTQHVPTRNQYYIATGIHYRSSLLDQEKVLNEAVIDRYTFIRDTYFLLRKSQVYDGHPPRTRYDEWENGANQ
jgi:phospholipid-binding lipoprotein MlaA